MKLRLLFLDDQIESLHECILRVFGPFLVKGAAIPQLSGGRSKPFQVKRFGNDRLSIEITSNKAPNRPDAVIAQVQREYAELPFDIVFIDDNWGAHGSAAGQQEILPALLKLVSDATHELPVFVLFTQHWSQTERVTEFCKLMDMHPEHQNRMTGLSKDDASGFLLLVQRAVSARRGVDERERLKGENSRLLRRLANDLRPNNMIGASEVMREVYETINWVSKSRASVLITGESGTGKELVAKAIHAQSCLAQKPFVAVNSGAMPEQLLESELFGHVKGAFTGAIQDKKGRFELADGGTLFLDEVGDMSPVMQVRLLRVIQVGQFERVGGEKTITVNVRIICATNKNLESMVKSGKFREDLYYRLNVLPILIPPLSSRRSDIPELVNHFTNKWGSENGKPSVDISSGALAALMTYDWAGNVRELENCIEYAASRSGGEEVRVNHLPPKIRDQNGIGHNPAVAFKQIGELKLIRPDTVRKANSNTVECYIKLMTEYARQHGLPKRISDLEPFIALQLKKPRTRQSRILGPYLSANASDWVLFAEANKARFDPILQIIALCRPIKEGLLSKGLLNTPQV
ncbi:MAG: sigma-54 dependent transcriptional regulator [bacterium]